MVGRDGRREPQFAADAAVPAFTMAPAVWSKFLTDPLTEAAVDVFEQAAVAL